MPSYATPLRVSESPPHGVHGSVCNCRWDDPPHHCPVYDADLFYLDQFGARAQESRSRSYQPTERAMKAHKSFLPSEPTFELDFPHSTPPLSPESMRPRINYVPAANAHARSASPATRGSLFAPQDPNLPMSSSWPRSSSPPLAQPFSHPQFPAQYQPAPQSHSHRSMSVSPPDIRYEIPQRQPRSSPTFEFPGPIEPQARWWEYPGVLPEPKHEPGHRNHRFVPRPILKKCNPALLL
ncbi:hypothetical protein BOTBODRAFT_33441 [Botryobasidium botryosum FD-172 SS1]|uniref:Uncharacterized protein n=1 Tax=Botryobasidium botryosum (strain FD-172 SS1) TaxID=930990 RepID=A0A067MQ58_BOTB1|nr:hypothetical protein BOTBODRAFT_33441 [Botryobasidium botryosum FD-172 SS1]